MKLINDHVDDHRDQAEPRLSFCIILYASHGPNQNTYTSVKSGKSLEEYSRGHYFRSKFVAA